MSKNVHSGRSDQRKSALKRWEDARYLRNGKHWRGAMYLAGYAIECRLKAVLMEKFNVNRIQELESALEKRIGRSINAFTHNIEVLFSFTDAYGRLKDRPITEDLRAYRKCNTWTVAWRYNPTDGNEKECNEFMNAVHRFSRYIECNN